MNKDEIKKAAQIILESKLTLALTGAGISVESGIPDFRSPGGLWEITENYEKFLQQQTETKSSKKLRDEGEDNFMLLSETFKDFVGYKIEKKSHQAHKGDFHLFFENFNVLVDLKNYTGSVQKKELDKIEHDLSINDTMDFGWLISYESNVSDWNRFPIMCKWILTDIGLKLIIVNKLNSNKNPTDILRSVWNMTNEIHAILSKTKEVVNSELIKIKERDYNVLQKIKTLQKRLSEMKRKITSMSQTAKDIENDIIDIISMFTNELSKNEFDSIMREFHDPVATKSLQDGSITPPLA